MEYLQSATCRLSTTVNSERILLKRSSSATVNALVKPVVDECKIEQRMMKGEVITPASLHLKRMRNMNGLLPIGLGISTPGSTKQLGTLQVSSGTQSTPLPARSPSPNSIQASEANRSLSNASTGSPQQFAQVAQPQNRAISSLVRQTVTQGLLPGSLTPGLGMGMVGSMRLGGTIPVPLGLNSRARSTVSDTSSGRRDSKDSDSLSTLADLVRRQQGAVPRKAGSTISGPTASSLSAGFGSLTSFPRPQNGIVHPIEFRPLVKLKPNVKMQD